MLKPTFHLRQGCRELAKQIKRVYLQKQLCTYTMVTIRSVYKTSLEVPLTRQKPCVSILFMFQKA